MTIKTSSKTPVVFRVPECPVCGSQSTASVRSQGFVMKDDDGTQRRAQKQYRVCRSCGHGWKTILIKNRIDEPGHRRRSPKHPSVAILAPTPRPKSKKKATRKNK